MDYTLRVDGDFRGFLAGLGQLDQAAAQAGQVIGERIDQGIKRFSTTSLAGLQQELNRLQQRQLTVGVDTAAFDKLGQRIKEIEGQIDAAQRKKLSLGIDPGSINALNAKLAELNAELNRVAIGSARFKELQGAIQTTQQELGQVGKSTDSFRLLDGVIQGVAFSLSNAVVGGAMQAAAALQGMVGEFAALDTQLRLAAAASGEAGAYYKLARAVDQVGIEASGTTLEVAQLTTELIRGGMSVEQANASLGGIVRGAEATGTSFDQMGRVVSATLKGFGLDAREASRVVDALVQGANASATDVTGMGEAFKYAAPVAKLLGLSVEDLGVAVGLLTNTGIQASEAGVTLRNGLSQLAQAAQQAGGSTQKLTGQAKEAADAMKTLGLDIYEANGTLKPMQTVLLQLKGAFDQLSPSAAVNLASKLFGGNDDGTKWIAMLSQSREEIVRMAETMANSKGATDTARDAMQGFELKGKQLQGTLQSLSVTVGRVAASALIPFLDAANNLIGAIAALPDPVKNLASAVILVGGAFLGAATAVAVYNAAIKTEIVQDTIAATLSLAGAIGSNLRAGLQFAIALWPRFIALMAAASTTQFTFAGALAATGTALKATFLGAVELAVKAITGFITFLNSASFASFIAGAKAATLAIAPMALAIGSLVAMGLVWKETLSESSGVQKDFADAQTKASESTRTLEKTIGSLGQTTSQQVGIWQQLKNFLSQDMGMREAAIQAQQLQAGFDKGEEAARGFFNSLRDTKSITADQASQGKAYIQFLKDEANTLKQVSAAMRIRADLAERQGRNREAQQLRDQADALETQAQGSLNLAAATEKRVQALGKASGLSRSQLAMTEEQIKLDKERIATERELNNLIAAGSVRGLDAQIATGQALLSITQAMGQLEAARFSVAQARLGYETKKITEKYDREIELMQRGGFTEEQIAQAKIAKEKELQRIKALQDANDKEMLDYKARAMAWEQQMARAMLLLNQEKARAEANLEALSQRQAILDAEAKLAKAKDDYEKAALQKQLDLENQKLKIIQEKQSLLSTTQPMERATLGIQQQAAIENLKAEAAGKGLRVHVEAISKSNIDKQFGSVASNMSLAASDAQEFYSWLRQASALPGARWAGGPVEAGGQYRINELGQEAFLSAGRISLIEAPSNSIWRAPSSGIVIPAGVTARLQGQGRIPLPSGGSGSGASVAQLAIEVGKLREEVGNLARRDWSVHVQHRTGPTGSQVLRTLLG